MNRLENIADKKTTIKEDYNLNQLFLYRFLKILHQEL